MRGLASGASREDLALGRNPVARTLGKRTASPPDGGTISPAGKFKMERRMEPRTGRLSIARITTKCPLTRGRRDGCVR